MSGVAGIPEGFEPHALGNGMYWSPIVDAAGNWIGIHEWHRCIPTGNEDHHRLAAGSVLFDSYPGDGPRWHLVNSDPLTIDPSILCGRCRLHGWIREGKWTQ